MITGDLDAALGEVIGAAGPWRPGPRGLDATPRTDATPGTYATPVAFRLAARADAGRVSAGPAGTARADAGRVSAGPAGTARAGGGRAGAGRVGGGDPGDPARIAARLAGRLQGLDWVAAATETGGGHLTVTVTAETLAALAVRITQAGPACARSAALAATSLTAPRDPGLASAPTWDEARRRLTAALSGRLAQAAGAAVHFQEDSKRMAPATPATSAGRGPVADAIAFAGADAITFALARLPPGGPARVDAASVAAHRLGNPAYAVRYAHAHAASALRQAADRGLGLGDAGGFQPRSLAHPSEQSLLYELSWLPERVAGAARRRQPDVLARYLETLAVVYLDCQQHCPAVWPGMPAYGSRAGPATRAVITARLWLAAAARTALRAGLDLLGVSAPDRL